MRHNFVNDIGDYAKYALLRALCSSGPVPVRLGVIWYLTEHAESNGDGRRRPHLSRGGWETLDPPLLATMRLIEGRLQHNDDLHVRLIEKSGVLPVTTAYFSEPLPHSGATAPLRMQERAAWFYRAREKVRDCNVVFVDPDNGLEVPSVRASSRLAVKYVTVAEVSALIADGAGVIMYQHADRSPWQVQRQRITDRLLTGVGSPLTIRSMRFGASGSRAFFCISATPALARTIDNGLTMLSRRVAGWDKGSYLTIE